MATQRELPLGGGFDLGPLFQPGVARRPPKPRMRSTHRDRVVRSRIPPWADRAELRRIENERRRLSRETGKRWSIDHVVPLNHSLVSGLHRPANLRLLPLLDNMRKGNAWWPGMPVEQLPLLGED